MDGMLESPGDLIDSHRFDNRPITPWFVLAWALLFWILLFRSFVVRRTAWPYIRMVST
jgi:hypothetical protein